MEVSTKSQTLSEADFVTRRDLGRALGVSQRSISNFIRAGRLPEPIRITRRTVRWPAQQLADFFARPGTN
jgi:predicted DNA-binding transcriptional regulator AlpA